MSPCHSPDMRAYTHTHTGIQLECNIDTVAPYSPPPHPIASIVCAAYKYRLCVRAAAPVAIKRTAKSRREITSETHKTPHNAYRLLLASMTDHTLLVLALLQLILLLLLPSSRAQGYCDPALCPGGARHVVCGNSGVSRGQSKPSSGMETKQWQLEN